MIIRDRKVALKGGEEKMNAREKNIFTILEIVRGNDGQGN